MAETRTTTYKRFNGLDWDIHYFKAPASVISETSTRKWLSSTDKARIDDYLVAGDFNKAFKLLQLDGNAQIPVGLIPGGLDYVPIAGGTMTGPLMVPRLTVGGDLLLNDHIIKQVGTGFRFANDTDNIADLTTAGLHLYGTGKKITGLSAPSADTDAVNKAYVDQLVAQGTEPIEAVRVATTQNITLSGLGSIDGITLVAGDRVLVKDQTTASANGIYTVNSSAWTKVANDSKKGSLVSVTAGNVNKGHQFYAKTDTNWIEYYVYDDYTAGAGITINGMTISIGTGKITNAMLAGSIEEGKLGAISQGKITEFTSNDNLTPTGANVSRTIGNHLVNLYSMIKQVKGTTNAHTTPTRTLEALNTFVNGLDLGNKTYEGSASPSNSGYKTGDVYLQFDA